MNDQMMTLNEVAEFLKVSPRTVWTLLKEGAIQAARIGRQWRVRHEAVLEYVKSTERPVRHN